jgi:hypothetical protein
MINSSIGLGAQTEIDGGSLDLGYLPVSSGRTGFSVLGVLGERVTLSATFGGGFVGILRNSNADLILSPLLAVDGSLSVDLTVPRRVPGGRLFMPLGASAIYFPVVHDGTPLSFAVNIGLGYRYR